MDENKKTNYAAIDIGSNAVRLLIKEIKEDQATLCSSKLLLLRVPLRLGFDVFHDGKISEKKAKNLVRLMKSFHYLMKIYKVKHYRACATSAMREAKNGATVINQIAQKVHIHIDIIDGQEEAKIIYKNHVERLEDRTGNYMYVDVGGGSTEINFMVQGELLCSRSYNIGTVRQLSGVVEESEWERLKTDLAELTCSYPQINIIGSGGNINKLYRLAEKKDKKTMSMSVDILHELHARLKALTPEERMEQFSLKPDRADVIVPAGDIFLLIADIIKAEYIYVPVIGLSDGIIDELYLQQNGNHSSC